jgi:hypothetical protein
MQEIAQGLVTLVRSYYSRSGFLLLQDFQLVRSWRFRGICAVLKCLSINSQHFNEIMPAIYSRFMDKEAREWRQIYKVSEWCSLLGHDFTHV